MLGDLVVSVSLGLPSQELLASLSVGFEASFAVYLVSPSFPY